MSWSVSQCKVRRNRNAHIVAEISLALRLLTNIKWYV